MIGIAQKVARNFSDAVRSRGQSYFLKGRVSVMAARPGEVVAKVRGTSKYRVRLRMRGSKLLASCSCPYFSPQGEPCKHLWATLLLAESRGFLQSAPMFPVHLVTESPRRTSTPGLPDPRVEGSPSSTINREGSHPDHTDMGMEILDLRPPPPRPPGSHLPPSSSPTRGAKSRGKDRSVRRDPLTDTSTWSQRGPAPRDYRPGPTGRVKPNGPGLGHATGAGADSARTKAVNRNAKRLLVYVLDVAATLAQNQVVIDLARRQRKTTGEWGPLRPWYYAPHAAHVKYDPEDRLILALLDEAQGSTLHGVYTTPGPAASNTGPPAPGSSGATNGTATGPGPRPAPAPSSAAAARAAAERAMRGMRRFVLRKDQASLGGTAGAHRKAAAPPHRRRGRSADRALGRRPALAVFARCSGRAGGQTLGLARLAPPR